MKVIFFFLVIGKIKKPNRSANPKWIALAGKPLNIPKSKINGNGEAYHNWNSDHIIAIDETIFKWIPESLFVGDKSSSIFVFISELILSSIMIQYNNKKKGPIVIIGPLFKSKLD